MAPEFVILNIFGIFDIIYFVCLFRSCSSSLIVVVVVVVCVVRLCLLQKRNKIKQNKSDKKGTYRT